MHLAPSPPEIEPLDRLSFYAGLGLISFMEPDTEEVMRERARRELVEDEYDSPHERPWHVSFHASQFPGEPVDACERFLLYRMMNIPSNELMPPWVTSCGTVGKAGELDIANAWFKDGRLLAVPEGQPGVHQLGFADPQHWLTGSVDLPILKKGWRKPYVVEIKCLGAETMVLTSKGRRCIYELANAGHAMLVNGRGEWQDCEIKHFGQQRVWEIELERAGSTRTIMATGDHRWFVDKTGPDGKNVISAEVVTSDLMPGQKLTCRMPYSKIKKSGDTRPSPFGVARGVVYGDGTLKVSGGGSMVDLFGEKALQLLRFFSGCKTSDLDNGGLRVCDLPAYFKSDLPPLDEGVSYLYGWLAGYFAADGTVSKNGSCYLDSADWGSLSFVQDLCTWLGIGTRDIYMIEAGEQSMPNGSIRDYGIKYRICIQAYSLTESFFLIDEHRSRWLDRGVETPSKRKDRWVITSVRDTGVEDDVYCAIVPGSEQFVLDGFILTGNSKADEVLQEMLTGRRKDGTMAPTLRKPDDTHVRQLKASLGLAHEHDWGSVTVCDACWRIQYADIFDLLSEQGRVNPAIPHQWLAETNLQYCYWCGHEQGDDVTFVLEPPDCGEIYYWSRSWPRTTKSFFITHDPEFMRRGREVLAQARHDFIVDKLPDRQAHFQWSVGPCAGCQFKPSCRLDSGLLPRKRKPDPSMVVTKLSQSNAVEHARALRPHYDFETIRDRVFAEWS